MFRSDYLEPDSLVESIERNVSSQPPRKTMIQKKTLRRLRCNRLFQPSSTGTRSDIGKARRNMRGEDPPPFSVWSVTDREQWNIATRTTTRGGRIQPVSLIVIFKSKPKTFGRTDGKQHIHN